MMMKEMMVAPGKAGHAEEEGDGEEDVRHKAEQHRAPVDLKYEEDDHDVHGNWEEDDDDVDGNEDQDADDDGSVQQAGF